VFSACPRDATSSFDDPECIVAVLRGSRFPWWQVDGDRASNLRSTFRILRDASAAGAVEDREDEPIPARARRFRAFSRDGVGGIWLTTSDSLRPPGLGTRALPIIGRRRSGRSIVGVRRRDVVAGPGAPVTRTTSRQAMTTGRQATSPTSACISRSRITPSLPRRTDEGRQRNVISRARSAGPRQRGIKGRTEWPAIFRC
jgi:hypothetical protein